MNFPDRILPEIARYTALDVMLADIAVGIQLTPTDYQRAIDHYHAIHEGSSARTVLCSGWSRSSTRRAASPSAPRWRGTRPTMNSTST